MPVSADELIRLLSVLAEEENLRVTVKETMKAGVMAGTGATIGGLMGGPLGIAVGGTCGSLFAAYMTNGKFKSVPQILQEMKPEQKQKLYAQYQIILQGLDYSDIYDLQKLITGDSKVKGMVLEGLSNYLQNELNMAIVGNVG
ncbi:protein C19orf12 homolog isoform X2 [Anneissia japonica]|uniref:protein C19orf12 homolog isoform X2 n=1 Tax=Anneissia japonica TaxID=1529436 RepID=UPI00142585DE|nr:protein C19orf12 homolog isoform X2 [Anneissia japonica]